MRGSVNDIVNNGTRKQTTKTDKKKVFLRRMRITK